jgi:hypothetical protein
MLAIADYRLETRLADRRTDHHASAPATNQRGQHWRRVHPVIILRPSVDQDDSGKVQCAARASPRRVRSASGRNIEQQLPSTFHGDSGTRRWTRIGVATRPSPPAAGDIADDDGGGHGWRTRVADMGGGHGWRTWSWGDRRSIIAIVVRWPTGRGHVADRPLRSQVDLLAGERVESMRLWSSLALALAKRRRPGWLVRTSRRTPPGVRSTRSRDRGERRAPASVRVRGVPSARRPVPEAVRVGVRRPWACRARAPVLPGRHRRRRPDRPRHCPPPGRRAARTRQRRPGRPSSPVSNPLQSREPRNPVRERCAPGTSSPRSRCGRSSVDDHLSHGPLDGRTASIRLPRLRALGTRQTRRRRRRPIRSRCATPAMPSATSARTA